jgi:UDP-2,4-diacetamido-2,4,6-trideoxy-beta-L-altropyranose hydrolase
VRVAIFRADASQHLGCGHVMRVASLARGLRELGWECHLVACEGTQIMVPAQALDSMSVTTLAAGDELRPEALLASAPDGCDLLVVDHYHWTDSQESSLRGWAKKILVIDDLADRVHDCDFLLDQTSSRLVSDYEPLVPPSCRILTGADYALLRPQFAVQRPRSLSRRRSGAIQRLLVQVGGSDPDDLTGLILREIAGLDLGLTVDVILGPGAPHVDTVREQARTMGAQLHVGVTEVASLMARADLAIGSGGVSASERCSMGLASLLIVIADNQRDVVSALVQTGAARGLRDHGDLRAGEIGESIRTLVEDSGATAEMAIRAAGVCDGLGLPRVLLELDPPVTRAGVPVALQPVRWSDRDLILAWQKHPDTRRYFNNPEPPSRTEHEAWLRAKLDDPQAQLHLILADGQPAGILRTDPEGEEGVARVSILMAPEARGRGLATGALRAGRRLTPQTLLRAQVHEGNVASERLFRAAGYERRGELFESDPIPL